jgi:hypothetical protein
MNKQHEKNTSKNNTSDINCIACKAKFSGPEVMNNTCGKTTHTTTVDRGFSVC